MDEVGSPGISLSVLSKAAEIQFLHTVDKVLLGNRWLRKITGIQPKFPYVVDSFEKRSLYNSQGGMENCVVAESGQRPDFRAPFKDWLKQQQTLPNLVEKGEVNDNKSSEQLLKQSPLLPRIIMVGIATDEAADTMVDLIEELERIDQVNQTGNASNGRNIEQRDPPFVVNTGDYAKRISARLVRREAN